MTATYQLSVNELDPDFVGKLRTLFPQGRLTITVEEMVDETEFLLRRSENRVLLLASKAQADRGEVYCSDRQAV